MDTYLNEFGSDKENKLREFLKKLGVKSNVCTVTQKINWRYGLKNEHGSKDEYEQKVIDGCDELINFICERNDKKSPSFYEIAYANGSNLKDFIDSTILRIFLKDLFTGQRHAVYMTISIHSI